MKKYALLLSSAIFAVMLSGCKPDNYLEYEEAYFGKEVYQTAFEDCTDEDKKEVQPVLDEVEKAFSYIGPQEECEKIFGALSVYCPDNYLVSSEKHKIDFVTAKTEGDSGYIWIRYDQYGYDGVHEEEVTASIGVLSRINIKKDGDTWKVVDADEHP